MATKTMPAPVTSKISNTSWSFTQNRQVSDDVDTNGDEKEMKIHK